MVRERVPVPCTAAIASSVLRSSHKTPLFFVVATARRAVRLNPIEGATLLSYKACGAPDRTDSSDLPLPHWYITNDSLRAGRRRHPFFCLARWNTSFTHKGWTLSSRFPNPSRLRWSMTLPHGRRRQMS